MGLLDDEKQIEEVVQQKEEIKPTEAVEEKKEEIKKEEEVDDGGLAGFMQGMSKKTDKDTQQQNIEAGEGKNTDSSAGTAIKPKTTALHYANHELVAKLTLAALSVTMGLVLQYISQDWTEEAEKRYRLSDTRKKELEEPLSLMLEQSKSKYNPAIIFFISVIVAYVPMFIGAFRIRKKTNEEKKLSSKLHKKGTLDKGVELKFKEEVTAPSLEEEQERVKKTEIKEAVVVGAKFTKAQKERILAIKGKKGRRSLEDTNFLKELGLDGFI